LKTYFADKNNKIEIVETQDGGLFDGDLSQYDAFVFYTSGNLLDASGSKNDKAKPLTEAGLRKLIATVRAGKGFVGIHAATDSHSGGINEDGIDIYTKFVGARFVKHGAQQTATLTVVQPTQFSSLKAIESGKITTKDEWYAMNQFKKDIHVLLIQETEGMRGKEYERPPFPATWIRKEGEGRVAYTSFAHDNKYLGETVQYISDLIEWTVGRFEADTTPNIEKVTPGFGQMPK
jgi:type 1 glutamine amidotransferase